MILVIGGSVMWRSAFLKNTSNFKISSLRHGRIALYSSGHSTGQTGSKERFIYSIVGSAGFCITGAIVYGKYDSKFRSYLEENIPFVIRIYKLFPDDKSLHSKEIKETPLSKKFDVKNKESISFEEVKKKEEPAKINESKYKNAQAKNDIGISDITVKNVSGLVAESVLTSDKTMDSTFYEDSINETISKLNKVSADAMKAFKDAKDLITLHTNKLYEALDLPEANENIWEDVKNASNKKELALKLAKEKAFETRDLIKKLENDIKSLNREKAKISFIKNVDDVISQCLSDLETAETNIASAESEAKAAENYEKLVAKSKQQFHNELQIVLPNYLREKDHELTENDLNLLIAHAHRRIEQLQKQLAKQVVMENLRVDEMKRKEKEDLMIKSSKEREFEVNKQQVDIESIVASRIATIKENFETELRLQLHRQTAAHADHIQDALKIQEQELKRKHILELEEKLLHQKGVFLSEISGNMARLKGIINFLKAKSEFDKSNQKAQGLFLACEAMYFKLLDDNSEHLNPLAKDIATLKCSSDEENEYVNSIIASFPPEAVNRGIFSAEKLKQQFEKVKQVSRKVTFINENNTSLFSYFLSYLESLLIIDIPTIPNEELKGKVAVDTSEFDTFEILNRISYCLKINDLEQCLRYANLLSGKPNEVAKDWIHELVIHLETKLAVKALLSYAAAISVQAYH